MNDKAYVVKNEHGDHVVEQKNMPVVGGYFDRAEYEDAQAAANRYAEELNSTVF